MKNPVRLLLRVPVPWVFVLGYAVGLALQFILPHAVLSGRASWISVGVGAGLFALGAVIAGWGLTPVSPGKHDDSAGRAVGAAGGAGAVPADAKSDVRRADPGIFWRSRIAATNMAAGGVAAGAGVPAVDGHSAGGSEAAGDFRRGIRGIPRASAALGLAEENQGGVSAWTGAHRFLKEENAWKLV